METKITDQMAQGWGKEHRVLSQDYGATQNEQSYMPHPK